MAIRVISGEEMNNRERLEELRQIVFDLEKTNVQNINSIKTRIENLGIYANMNVHHPVFQDKTDKSENAQRIALDYIGGQILDIIEKEGWFAMNSAINVSLSLLEDLEKKV